ncbi:MAG: ribosomal protection-like ABC-F family protein, partial [Verrucomicrobiia bacterium]
APPRPAHALLAFKRYSLFGLPMLTLAQVSKGFAGRTLFKDLSLQIQPGDRVGLIGPNGAGKSTLFSLILGHQSPDSGSVSLQRGKLIGFLPQESAPAGDETILELATSVSEEMTAAMAAMRNHPAAGDERHQQAHERFVELDGYSLQAQAKRILSGLAFRSGDYERPARTLSGGWIMRAHLARLLVMEPDLLLLDEPTNHLDLESLGWFQNHLRNYSGAILTISHDRAFLNAICKSIVEISRQQLNKYTGNYDSFLRQRAEREAQYRAAYENQQREIAHLQAFVDRFRAKASKASQAQERLKRLERMERLEAPEAPEATVSFRFPQPPHCGHTVMTLRNVRQSYGEHLVYADLNLELERGERVVLVGPNGAGKSTLLKILADLVPLSAGERLPGHKVTIGYFAQHRTETLDLKRTVLAEAMAETAQVSEQQVRTILGSFLFRGDDVFKNVGVLSGGEKSRLALVKLLLNPPNLLLLDEPTTHLDIASIDALVNALADFNGTIVFVSHDVHFIRAIGRRVLHIDGGVLTNYPGDYDYYLEKTTATSDRAGLVARLGNSQPAAFQSREISSPSGRPAGMKEQREQRRQESQRRQQAARERREAEKQLAAFESEIIALEQRQAELTAQLEDPASYDNPALAMELNRTLLGVTESLERVNAEWAALAEKLAPQPDTDPRQEAAPSQCG